MHIFHDWEVIDYKSRTMIRIWDHREYYKYFVTCKCTKCKKIKYISDTFSELPIKIQVQMVNKSGR